VGIAVTWDNQEKTILREDLTTPWTWTEYDEATDRLAALIKSVNNRVDVIFNRNYSVTPHGDPFMHYRRIAEQLPANTGLVLVVGATNATRAAANFFLPLFPQLSARLAFVDSLGEARTILQDRQKRT
jgi:hypothetical protein